MKSNLEKQARYRITKALSKFEDTRFEKIHNVLFKNAEASIIVAREIADLIKAKQQNKRKLLCLAWQLDLRL
jgi:glucosamine-6-phosphate deaminase